MHSRFNLLRNYIPVIGVIGEGMGSHVVSNGHLVSEENLNYLGVNSGEN